MFFNTHRLYNIVSAMFSAPFIAALVTTLLYIYAVITIIELLILFLSTVIIPLVVSILWAWSKGIQWDYPERRHRITPFSLIVFGYFLGFSFLYIMPSTMYSKILVFSYLLNGFISLVITLWYKISIHVVGIAGPATFLYLINYIGSSIMFYILSVIVSYSRYRLKRHTLPQIILGYTVAISTTYIAYIVCTSYL